MSAAQQPGSAGGETDESTAALVAEILEIYRSDVPSAEADEEIAIRRIEEQQRYVAVIGDREVAYIAYRPVGDRTAVDYTYVEPELRGRGFAGDFIADVLDDLRGRGRLVIPVCPAVAAFISVNDQYADVLG